MTLCEKCLHAEVCAIRDGYDEGDERALTYCSTFRGWISVDERLPIGSNKGDMPENIIAYTQNGEVATGWLNVETWWLLYGDNDEHMRHGIKDVTHWMPLPEPPKGV